MMVEPYDSEFRRLVRLGAGARDIHGSPAEVAYAQRTLASDAFVEREVSRVETHRQGSCAVLEAFAGRAPRVLDVGCSTGGSTVAFAESAVLAPDVVIGANPDPLSLRAAEVRANGHRLERKRVSFVRTRPGRPLPFANDAFDLVVCVSVLEFLPTTAERRTLVEEMKRLVRAGGHLFLATPSPLRLRDVHGKRLFGDVVRRDGHPWASPPWTLRAMLSGWESVDIDGWVVARALRRAGVPLAVPRPIASAMAHALAWQKVLVRRPLDHAA